MRLSVRGVRKSFGLTHALTDVSLDVREGTVHALLGENGAGKSTLMKIVAGALTPDAGELLLDGAHFAPKDPLEARRRGVAIVHQELSVCPDLTVAENVVLGVEPHRFGWITASERERRVERALAPLLRRPGDIRPDQELRALSTADRQLVEIARALSGLDTRLLILDEPTSSLSSDDVERLFDAISSLKRRGLAILYISHFLEEIRRIADDFTVLRDGSTVAQGELAEVSNDDLVRKMAGRNVAALSRSVRAHGEVVLSLREVAGARLPLSASLELHRGEVLGVAGLLGSGRTELLRAIFGLEPVVRGQVRLGAFAGPASPATWLKKGMGFLSEDRKTEGLALSLSLAENLTLSKLLPLRRRGLLSLRSERQTAERWVERLGIRCRDVDQPASELSGGNQQKLALARLLYHDVDVFLLDEPTRGIDVRSRNEVHALIHALAEQGKAVLMISSQLPELLTVCDRIAVMHRGVLGAARDAAELDEHTLLKEATGA